GANERFSSFCLLDRGNRAGLGAEWAGNRWERGTGVGRRGSLGAGWDFPDGGLRCRGAVREDSYRAALAGDSARTIRVCSGYCSGVPDFSTGQYRVWMGIQRAGAEMEF